MAFIGGRFASLLQSEEGENAGKRPSASYARSRPLARPTPHDLPATIQKIRVELKILPFQTLNSFNIYPPTMWAYEASSSFSLSVIHNC